MSKPILIRDLCGPNYTLCVKPGSHTITNEGGQIDMVINVGDSNRDGKADSVTLVKYGRFMNGKAPRIFAYDRDGDGTVDEFSVLSQLRKDGSTVVELSLKRAGSGGNFGIARTYFELSGNSSQWIGGLAAYDLMYLCEWDDDDKRAGLCSWLNENGPGPDVSQPSITDPRLHPSNSAIRKYREWCLEGLEGIEMSEDWESSFSCNTRYAYNAIYDGIISDNVNREESCSASCSVKRGHSLLREAEFEFAGGQCGGEITFAWIHYISPEGGIYRHIPVDIQLTPAETLFRPTSAWRNVLTKYCDISTALPRGTGLDFNFEFRDARDSCDMVCDTFVNVGLARSVHFYDGDCNGFPEKREVAEYPIVAPAGTDPKVPLYTETVPMKRLP